MLLDTSSAGIIQPSHENTLARSQSVSPDETTDHEALLEATSTPTLSQSQSASPDETKSHEALLDATSTLTLSPDATDVSPSVEPNATQKEQPVLPEVSDKHILLPAVTTEQSSEVPDATQEMTNSNTQVGPIDSSDTVPEEVLSGTVSKEPDVNVQNSELLASASETAKEAKDNATMYGVEQPENQSGGQLGDTLETKESIDPNTETKSSETDDIAINSPTREQIIGEISYSDKSDAAHHDISSENTVSNFKPFETSSVVSELMEFSHTPETNGVNSFSSTGDSPSHQSTTTDSNNNALRNSSTTNGSVSSAIKRACLKSCIIQLTELSNQERNKWMSGTSHSTSRTTDTDEGSTTGSSSRYNMRTRLVNTKNANHKTGRKRPVVNYRESSVQDSGCDSDYEAKLRPPQPLDNKS